jgi:hypothetical protein
MLQERYLLLQAYLCLAAYVMRPLEARNPHYCADTKVRCCRAIRQLSHPDNSNILGKLTDSAVSLQDYRDAFAKKATGEEFHPVVVFFDYALEAKKARGSGPHKRKPANKFNKGKQTIEFGDEDNRDDRERVNVLTTSTVLVTALRTAKKQLCSDAEFNSKEYVTCEEPGNDPQVGRSFSQQKINARFAASSIAMHNQRLVTDWNHLTQHEIDIFLDELKKLSLRDDDFEGVPSQELATFLSMVFWTSATSKTVSEATRVRDVPNSKTTLGVLWDAEKVSWVIKPYTPRLRLVPKAILIEQALPMATSFSLPIPAEALEVMAKHFNRIKVSYDSVKIFKNKRNNLETAADDFFSKLRKREGGRQSLQSISGCLYFQLANLPGSDITAAMAICGKTDPLGVVPSHYTANGINWLKETYSRACRVLIGNDVPAISKKREGEKDPSGKANYFVGSRFVPKSETVTRLVENLRERIDAARDRYNKDQNPTELHKELTIYTVMMLGFATGFRAVRDPLFQESEIDRTTGFGLISDKDSDDFYNARIIWLPQLCIRQLDNYQRHVKSLQHWLFNRNQDLFFKVRRQGISGRSTSREFPALFLLNDSGDDLTVQPKLMEDLLAEINYHLPMNANRHYLRSNLIADNCPVEVVDAFMGHWERGQEPWCRYSGLSPSVYKEQLEKPLIRLLKRNAWVPEEGLAYGEFW